MPADAEVLLADDDDVGRYVVTTMLQRAGFDVRGVPDGLAAVDEARRQPPDLVILDVKMPQLNGFEACRRLKADAATEHIPVLLLSATFLESEYQVEGLEGGADAYLTQPVEAPVLAATVRALIRARRAETAVRDAARRWQTTFAAIDDGIVLLDADDVIRQANPALARMAGLAPDALPGRAAADVMPELVDALAALRRPGGPREFLLEVGDRVLRVRAAGLDWMAGADVRSVATFTDVTAERRAERERSALLEREREISRTLQQALVPDRLVSQPHLQLTAWHVAAETELVIGGDWYDAIRTERGLWLVIGDVAGHGVQAAAQAGQLRHSLRVYALEGAPLGEAVHAVNNLVADAGPPDFATVCIVAVAPDARTAEILNAGHPPPVLARAGERPRTVDAGRNTALGLPGTFFVSDRLELAPADRLLLYTDGLIERRGETLGTGLDRLLRRVAATEGLAPLSTALRDAVRAEGPLDDDVAVLAAQVEPPGPAR